MRIIALLLLLLPTACGGMVGPPSPGEQSATLPAVGNDATRDGFYDGGVFDPDLTRRNVALPE